jgi:hypothetical protein
MPSSSDHWLRLAERNGERCGGPVILAGLLMGLGVVQLASGPLAQTSRFSLELLILLVLQLVGPMLVALLALSLLLPHWMKRIQAVGAAGWQQSVPAAALVGALLLLLFLVAAVCGGVMASPRADLVGEFRDLLAGVLLPDVLRACLRAGVFLGLLCGWCQWRTQVGITAGKDSGRLVSDQLAEGLVLLLTVKLIWITFIDPLHLTASPQ